MAAKYYSVYFFLIPFLNLTNAYHRYNSSFTKDNLIVYTAPEINETDFNIRSHLDFPIVKKICSKRDKTCHYNDSMVCAMRTINKTVSYKQFKNSCYLFLSNMCDNPGEEYNLIESDTCDNRLQLRRNDEEPAASVEIENISKETTANDNTEPAANDTTETTANDNVETATDDNTETTAAANDNVETAANDNTETTANDNVETATDDNTETTAAANYNVETAASDNTETTAAANDNVETAANDNTETTANDNLETAANDNTETAANDNVETVTDDNTETTAAANDNTETAANDNTEMAANDESSNADTDTAPANSVKATPKPEETKLMITRSNQATTTKRIVLKEAFDETPCPVICPDTYKPVCLISNKGYGKYLKLKVFVNRCSAYLYYCTHANEFKPAPTLVENLSGSVEPMFYIYAANIDSMACGAVRYVNFAGFAETASSMGHYGWLSGDYRYSHILSPRERLAGHG